MPSRAQTHCTVPGCTELTSRGRCDLHSKRKARDRGRPSAHQRGYGAKWRRFRRWFIARYPVCECSGCGPKCCGGRAATTEVDHIVPKAPGVLDVDEDHCQGLCRSCHGAKTMRESVRGA